MRTGFTGFFDVFDPTPFAGLKLACGLALSVLLGVACAGEAEWKTLADRVVPHLMRGNLDQAERFAREALAICEKALGRDRPS